MKVCYLFLVFMLATSISCKRKRPVVPEIETQTDTSIIETELDKTKVVPLLADTGKAVTKTKDTNGTK